MCCILYIPAGVETPSSEHLKQVYLFNRHGCGFADSDGNHFKSLSFSHFVKRLQKRNINAACIIHFRLATHGSVCLENCHPFYDEAHDIWFAHNGVLDIESHDNMTDSEIFFRERFIPELEYRENDYDDVNLWRYTELYRGASRFIFMRGKEVKLLGKWQEIDGIYYSNLNWAYSAVHSRYYRA